MKPDTHRATLLLQVCTIPVSPLLHFPQARWHLVCVLTLNQTRILFPTALMQVLVPQFDLPAERIVATCTLPLLLVDDSLVVVGQYMPVWQRTGTWKLLRGCSGNDKNPISWVRDLKN